MQEKQIVLLNFTWIILVKLTSFYDNVEHRSIPWKREGESYINMFTT